MTDLKIQFQFASATNWVTNNNIGVGEYTDTYLYLVNDVDAFDVNFPGIRTAQNATLGTVLSSVEGGDKIRLVDSSNSDEVIDIFGVDGQNGETSTWNFSNSYVTRNNGSGPNTSFVESEWTITPAKNFIKISGLSNNTSFVMYDILGTQVLKGILENNKSIDINELSTGIYLLKTETGHTLKVIKD